MAAIRLNAVVTDDGQLIVKLPQNVPPGQIEIVLHTTEHTSTNTLREAARAKLAAAGLLGRAHVLPPDVIPPTEEEMAAAGQGRPDAKPMHELIDEDRGEH